MAHTVQLYSWLLLYGSYAVDYYCMNYTAHFFALILPHKVQYVHVIIYNCI